MGKIIFLPNMEIVLSGATHQILFEAAVPPVPPTGIWATMTQYYPFEEYLQDGGDWYIPDAFGNKSEYGYGVDPSYEGIYGNGLYNNYFSNRLRYPSSADNEFSGSFTVSAWVKFIENTYGATADRYIVEKINTAEVGGAKNYLIAATTSGGTIQQFYFSMLIDSTLVTITSTTLGGYGIDTWYNVVAVYDETAGMKLYVNNELVASNSVTGTLSTGNGTLNMTNDYGTSYYSLYGTLDEVALFNSALDTDDIATLYVDGGSFYNIWNDLTAYYDFVDMTNDSNCLDRVGTVDADYVYAWAVPWGTFTGTNAYFGASYQSFKIRIPSATSNSFTGSFSVSAFTNTNWAAGQPAQANIVVKYDNTAYDEVNYGLYFGFSGADPTQMDSVSFKATIGGTLRTLTTTDVTAPTTMWHPRHIVGTYDENVGMCLYVNGELKASNTITGAVSGANEGVLVLGNEPYTNANYIDAAIDELGLWSSVLSAYEVTKLYNNGTGRFFTT
jgi:hypothetical protein